MCHNDLDILCYTFIKSEIENPESPMMGLFITWLYGTLSNHNDKPMNLQFVKYFTSKGNSTGSIKAVKFYDCYYGKSPPLLHVRWAAR